MKYFFSLLLLVIGMSQTAQASSINGHALRFEWIVGDQPDAVLNSPVAGNYTVGSDVQTIFFESIRVGVSDNQVRLEWIEDFEFIGGYNYHGLRLTDAFGHVPDFLLFHQASGAGVSNVMTSFDSESLFINFATSGTVLAGSSALFEMRLSDNLPQVPLPATGLLLGGVLLCFARLRRGLSA